LKDKLGVAVALLARNPDTAALALGLQRCWVEAKRFGKGMVLLVAAVMLVGLPLLILGWVTRDHPRDVDEVSAYMPAMLVGLVWEVPVVALLVLAVTIFALWWFRRLYLSYRLTRYLKERAGADPATVRAAQRAISISPPEAIFRVFSIALPIFLVVVGALWAAALYLATTAALSCAHSSKCL
jgi:hypothetical protein